MPPKHTGKTMKNDYEIRGDVTVIFLRRRNGDVHEVLIDTDDLRLVRRSVSLFYGPSKGSTPYCNVYMGHRRGPGSKSVSLHRYLMQPPDGWVIDHINHNGLDNRRSNLRIVSRTINQHNRAKPLDTGVSGVHGVVWDKTSNRWRARGHRAGKTIYLGVYRRLVDAEAAANAFYVDNMSVLLKDPKHFLR